MVRVCGAILFLSLLTGCFSTTRKISACDGVTVIDYAATRRGAYLVENGDRVLLVSEPAPDTALEITTSLGLSAETIGDLAAPELQAQYAGQIVDLAKRSQTLQVLREALFRLSEMGASSDITTAERVDLYKKVLDTVRLIAAIEFANSNAPESTKEAVLDEFFSDVSRDTVVIPHE